MLATGIGILLDATVVRALLLPALVSLLGRWNWWFRAPVARALRVPASPAARGARRSTPQALRGGRRA